MKAINRMKGLLGRFRARIKKAIKRLWKRLREEPGYAETAAAFVVCGVDLVSRNPLLIRMIGRASESLVALARETLRDSRTLDQPLWALDPA